MKPYVTNVQYERDQDGFLTGFICDVYINDQHIATAIDNGSEEMVIDYTSEITRSAFQFFCNEQPPVELGHHPWHIVPTEAMMISKLVDEHLILEQIRELKKDHVVYLFQDDDPVELHAVEAKTPHEKTNVLLALQEKWGEQIKIFC